MPEMETDQIIIQDIKLEMSIGIYEKERAAKQPVLVSVTLDVVSNKNKELENIEEVVSYEEIVRAIQKLAHSRHFNLAEKFAEEIAELCLSHEKTLQAKISVIKTNIISQTRGVGVKIHRKKS